MKKHRTPEHYPRAELRDVILRDGLLRLGVPAIGLELMARVD